MANSTLDRFCGSAFWNRTLSWDTDDPDLTLCFEKTILIFIPCVFLWGFSSLEYFYLQSSKYGNIRWNFLNIAKLCFNTALLILSLVDMILAIHWSVAGTYIIQSVDIYMPLIKIISFELAGRFVYYNKKHGIRSSGVLFLFYFLCVLCGIPQLRTEIRGAMDHEPEIYYFYISYLIYYPLVVIMLLLNCFADGEPTHSKYPKSERPCPEQSSGFLSRLFFSWFDPLAWKGFRKPLVHDDLWQMKPEDGGHEVVALFNKHWQRTLRKHESTHPRSRVSYKTDSVRMDFVNSKKTQASVLPAIIKSFGPTFLFGALLKLTQDILTFASPQILRLLIDFVENKEEDWKGYFYAVLLFVVAVIQTIVLAQYFNRMFLVGMRIRTSLVSAIYRKALIMSNAARKESTVGEIVNLMSVDAQKFIELTAYICMIWSAPLQILLALYFLWDVLGPSVLAGLAVMIIMIPINGYIANRTKLLQIKQMKNKDERVKLMNEILSGIKVLKLYAWEPSFEAQVLKIRNKEMKVLKQAAYLNAGSSFIWSCAPFLVSLVTFATFVLVDEKNVLDATTAFVSLSLFNILRFPLSMLPMMISNMVQAKVSVDRINKFMNCEELDPNNVTHEPSEDPIIIEDGNFNWGEGETLKDISMRCARGSLTAVVGQVGSGKSSLISAMLGEMAKTSGRVNTDGSIAYVSQQAWIQNATLQENILFGKPLNEKVYHRIVEACALKPDFDMLPAGDQTEIGEKGINLSGGQKQRISVARAVYADSDIYFLDDPLSAVDSHVGKHIFDKVLGPNGLLRKKTRVLVTHGITYLPQTDNIVVLAQGKISETGTYDQLLKNKGAFSDFLMQHITEAAEHEDEDNLEELQNQLSSAEVPEEFARHIRRARSRVSESVSETGSDKANASLMRQRSTDSSNLENSVKGKSETPVKQPVVGEKLIEAEKAEVGSVKWEVYKHYLMSIGLGLTAVTLILNVVFQGFSIGSNVWLSEWSTDSEMNNANGTVNTEKRDLYLGVYGALGIGQALSMFIAALTLFVGALRAARQLHDYVLTNAMRTPLAFYDVTPIGRILNRFSKDIDTVDTVLPLVIRAWIACLFGVIATLVVISFTTPLFIVVIIPIAILYFFIQRFYVATSRQLKRLESVSRSPIYSHFGESVTGAVAIRAFGEQKRFIQESEDKVDFNQSCYFPSIISNRWLAVRLEMVGNLIILFAGLFAVIEKDQSPGLVGLSISYALQITQTLNWLVRMTSDVETNIVAVERIKEYGETKQEAPWTIANKAPPPSWPDSGAVVFKDYAVRYREGLDLVLKKVSFEVKGGEKVGIVGRTGAGKSSLTLALFRIIEAANGEIIIDGQNIADMGLHDLRSRLTIIPQDAVLFSGSLRMNLDPFDKHSDNEVWEALEHAHLKQFVVGLPAGLHHEVAEGGENLSVGQRQLICLSRALLRKTKVLVLDEATAAVDLETDDLIQRTIRTEFKDCTVLTIAHRLNTIMDSDRVIVLDKGAIHEFDTPANLLADRSTIFHGMCQDAGLA
ncbi:multidrug resistance-associated protein 1 isoform X1 [Atheta coriaria]|uniref:multidrug resistance-associated protein 1 isoform X1 n=1 Tax=Dalotia coriaria TaxID=877792 RepID=UPI0031F3538A